MVWDGMEWHGMEIWQRWYKMIWDGMEMGMGEYGMVRVGMAHIRKRFKKM
jgi:hypothetical protein